MNFPCPNKVVCPGTDSPFANLSSEAPDREIFIGQNWGWGWNFPPIDSNWATNSCLGVCTSSISQADADQCAAINNLICLSDTWGPPGTGTGSSGPPLIYPPSTVARVYYSQEQFCLASCADGSPFIYGVPAGMFAAFNQDQANLMAYSAACQGAAANIICLSDLISQACLGEAYAADVTVNKNRQYSFSIVSGSLPPGITMNQTGPNRVGFDGTPTAGGDYTFVLRANDPTGIYMQKSYTIHVLALTPATLPDATEGNFYVEQLNSTGGVGAVAYSLDSGTFPNGVSMDGTGRISGTPHETGTFDVVIKATDSGLNSCLFDYSLKVNPGDCADWASMVWTVGSPFGCITINNFSGGFGEVRADHPCATSSFLRDRVGSLSYTGPGCNCQVEVTFNRTNATETGGCGFQIVQGTTILVNYTNVLEPLSGSTIIPFSLLPGVGINQNITIRGQEIHGIGGGRYYTEILGNLGVSVHTLRSFNVTNV